ncbi:hypothetical protein WA577_003447, partial [Blastocystis sp. JDR]
PTDPISPEADSPPPTRLVPPPSLDAAPPQRRAPAPFTLPPPSRTVPAPPPSRTVPTPVPSQSPGLPPAPSRPAPPPKVRGTGGPSASFPTVTVACPELEGLTEEELAEEEDFMTHLSHPNILRFAGFTTSQGVRAVKEGGLTPLPEALPTLDVTEEMAVEWAVSVLYALRYAWNATDLPYGTVGLEHLYVEMRRKTVKLDLPEWRCVQQRKGETIKNDLRGLHAILKRLEAYVGQEKKAGYSEVMGMCLSRFDKSMVESMIQKLTALQ